MVFMEHGLDVALFATVAPEACCTKHRLGHACNGSKRSQTDPFRPRRARSDQAAGLCGPRWQACRESDTTRRALAG